MRVWMPWVLGPSSTCTSWEYWSCSCHWGVRKLAQVSSRLSLSLRPASVVAVQGLLGAPAVAPGGAHVGGVREVVAQVAVELDERIALGAGVALVLVELHLAVHVHGPVRRQLADVARLQVQLPAVVGQREALVLVGTGGGGEEHRGAEVLAVLGLVYQPQGAAEEDVTQAGLLGAGQIHLLAAEGNHDLRIDDVAAQLGEVHEAQHAHVERQAQVVHHLPAIHVQVVGLVVLQVEQGQVGARRQRRVVAGIGLHIGVGRRAATEHGQCAAGQRCRAQGAHQVVGVASAAHGVSLSCCRLGHGRGARVDRGARILARDVTVGLHRAASGLDWRCNLPVSGASAVAPATDRLRQSLGHTPKWARKARLK